MNWALKELLSWSSQIQRWARLTGKSGEAGSGQFFGGGRADPVQQVGQVGGAGDYFGAAGRVGNDDRDDSGLVVHGELAVGVRGDVSLHPGDHDGRDSVGMDCAACASVSVVHADSRRAQVTLPPA